MPERRKNTLHFMYPINGSCFGDYLIVPQEKPYRVLLPPVSFLPVGQW